MLIEHGMSQCIRLLHSHKARTLIQIVQARKNIGESLQILNTPDKACRSNGYNCISSMFVEAQTQTHWKSHTVQLGLGVDVVQPCMKRMSDTVGLYIRIIYTVIRDIQ